MDVLSLQQGSSSSLRRLPITMLGFISRLIMTSHPITSSHFGLRSLGNSRRYVAIRARNLPSPHSTQPCCPAVSCAGEDRRGLDRCEHLCDARGDPNPPMVLF